MAHNEQLQSLSYEASADLSANQFRLVSLDANGRVQQAGANAQCVGVQQNKASALGNATEVGFSGRAKIVAGAAVAIDDQVESDATGRAITATGVGDHEVQGRALTAASAAGELVEVLLERSEFTI